MLSVGNTKMSKLSYFIIKSLDWLTGSFQCCTVTTNQSMQMCVGALGLPPWWQARCHSRRRLARMVPSLPFSPSPSPYPSPSPSPSPLLYDFPTCYIKRWNFCVHSWLGAGLGTCSGCWTAAEGTRYQFYSMASHPTGKRGSSTKANRVDSPVHCWPEMHRRAQPRPGLPRASINLWAIMNAY